MLRQVVQTVTHKVVPWMGGGGHSYCMPTSHDEDTLAHILLDKEEVLDVVADNDGPLTKLLGSVSLTLRTLS